MAWNKIALLDVGRQPGARSAALHVDDDERDLGHRRPTDCFGLERNAGAGAAGDREISRDRKTECDRDRSQLVLGLDEKPAVFREFAPQNFHHRRPGRDWVTGAVTHPRGNQPVGERLVAIHRDLRPSANPGDMLELVTLPEEIAERVAVAGRKRHDRGVDDALVFARELFFDQRGQLLDIEIKDFCDQAENKDVFALVLRRSAERFDG